MPKLAARSTAEVCSRTLTGIADSNLAGSKDACLF